LFTILCSAIQTSGGGVTMNLSFLWRRIVTCDFTPQGMNANGLASMMFQQSLRAFASWLKMREFYD
jgi:hypothetical protein